MTRKNAAKKNKNRKDSAEKVPVSHPKDSVPDLFTPGHPAPSEEMDPFQEMYYTPFLYDHGIFVRKATPGGGKSYAAHEIMAERVAHAIRTNEKASWDLALDEAEEKLWMGDSEDILPLNSATETAPLIVFISPQVSHCTKAYDHIRTNLEEMGYTEKDYAPYLVYIPSIPDCVRRVLPPKEDSSSRKATSIIPEDILPRKMQEALRSRYVAMNAKEASRAVRDDFYSYMKKCRKEIRKNILKKEGLEDIPKTVNGEPVPVKVAKMKRNAAIRKALEKPEYDWFHMLYPAYRKGTACALIMSASMAIQTGTTPFSGGYWLSFFEETPSYLIVDESDTVKSTWRDSYIEQCSKGQMSVDMITAFREIAQWAEEREGNRGPITENGPIGLLLQKRFKKVQEGVIGPMIRKWQPFLRMDIANEHLGFFENKQRFLYRDFTTKTSTNPGLMRIRVNVPDDKARALEDVPPSGTEQETARVNLLYMAAKKTEEKGPDKEEAGDKEQMTVAAGNAGASEEDTQNTEKPGNTEAQYLSDFFDDFPGMMYSLINLYVRRAVDYIASIEKNRGNQTDDESNLALKSFLSRCGWGSHPMMETLFKNFIRPYGPILARPRKNQGLHTFYDDGFSQCEIGKVGYAGNVELRYASCRATPEAIIVNLARKNRVVLVSATSDSERLGNFDLEYIKERIREDFHVQTKEEKQRIADFLRLDELENRLRIVCADGMALQDPPETENRNALSYRLFKDKLFARAEQVGIRPKEDDAEEVFENDLAEIFCHYDATVNRKGKKINPFNYIVNRYLCLADFYFEAQLYDLQSILCYEPCLITRARGPKFLTTEETKEADGFVEEVLYDLLDEIDRTFGFVPFEKYCLTAKDFRENDGKTGFDRVREDYREGKKVCVFTTPSSAGIGVNLTLPIRKGEDVFEIPAAGRKVGTERNFSGVFLGKFTNLFMRPTPDMPDMDENEQHRQMFTVMYETAEAHERCAITAREKEKRIMTCLRRHIMGQDPLAASPLAASEILYRMEQVTGRLFRCPVYDRTILYGCAGENVTYLANVLDGTDPLLNPIMRDIAKRMPHRVLEPKNPKWAIDLQKNAHRTAHVIKLLLKGIFEENKSSIEEYNKLKDILKTGVVISGDAYEQMKPGYLRTMYTKVPQKIAENGYKYIALTSNYDSVLVGETPEDVRSMGDDANELKDIPCLEVSSYASGIQRYHSLAGFREWARKMEFWDGSLPQDAESFYILNPTAFNNLYKGRVGEAVFDFMCETYGLPYREIEDPSKFEHADRLSDDGRIAIDVKNYSDGKDHDVYEELKKVIANVKGDALKCDEYWFVGVRPGKRAYVATSGKGADQTVVTQEGRTIRIRMMQLFIEKNGTVKPDETALKMLRKRGEEIC